MFVGYGDGDDETSRQNDVEVSWVGVVKQRPWNWSGVTEPSDFAPAAGYDLDYGCEYDYEYEYEYGEISATKTMNDVYDDDDAVVVAVVVPSLLKWTLLQQSSPVLVSLLCVYSIIIQY